jgi:Uncharacterised nucleotidyltransferase
MKPQSMCRLHGLPGHAENGSLPVAINHLMPAEARLLFLCARVFLDDEELLSLRDLAAQPDIDWHFFLQGVLKHGIAPLAYLQLTSHCKSYIPPEVRCELERCYKAIAFANLKATGELLRLERVFLASGIHAVWFKGPMLAHQAYGNLTLRGFSDLDVLIPTARTGDVTRMLLGRGYLSHFNFTTPQQEHLYKKVSNQHCFHDPRSRICIDVHWALTETSFSFSNIMPLATRQIELAGKYVTTFDIEATLCLLCYHGCKHRWTQLRWIADIGELVRHNLKLEWRALMGCARLPIGTKRMLKLGLFLAHSGLATPLPSSVSAWIESDHRVISMGHKILQSIASLDTSARPGILLATMDSFPDRLRYWSNRLWNPSGVELEALALPDFMFFIYRWIRYFRLICKYVTGRN